MLRSRIYYSTLIATLSVCLALTSGCSSQQVASTESIESASAEHAEKRMVTPKEAIALAEEKLAEANEANLAFFSPLHLSQAQESLSRAKAFAAKPVAGKPNAAIEEALAAREYIKNGLTNKADVLIYLKEAIAHKRVLQKLGVPELFEQRYAEALYGFSQLIKVIEEGDPNKAITNQKPFNFNSHYIKTTAKVFS